MTRDTAVILLSGSIVLLALYVTESQATQEQHFIAAYMRRATAANETIMAEPTYWFDLTDVRYLSWVQLLNYQNLHPGTNVGDALNAIRPEVLVIDGARRKFILADDANVPYTGAGRYLWDRRFPADIFDSFLACRGQLTYRIETKAFSLVEIYRIDWERTCP